MQGFNPKNKFEELVQVVGFITRNYHDCVLIKRNMLTLTKVLRYALSVSFRLICCFPAPARIL